ncbi:hypothetical protein [Yersinia mollaretii]|nr:hypothetical protein [Yersinia mollaretii]
MNFNSLFMNMNSRANKKNLAPPSPLSEHWHDHDKNGYSVIFYTETAHTGFSAKQALDQASTFFFAFRRNIRRLK